MNLNLIIHRIKEGLEYIDNNTLTSNTNRRDRNITYLQGLKSMFENQVTEELMSWWLENFPDDFNNTHPLCRELTYPEDDNAYCDLAFSSNAYNYNNYEWAIELKYIQLVGDNGKNNDHTIQKVLSPYLKDRSLIHDAKRLKQSQIAEKKCVIGFGFEYNFEIIETLRVIHPNETQRLSNLKKVLSNNDHELGFYGLMPLIQIVERHLTGEDLINENVFSERFNANRHPCGGEGKVFGWKIIN